VKVAPYAATAQKAAKAGFAPANSIVIAGDWKLRDTAVWWHATWHAVCPPDRDPTEFDWKWVAGFDCLLLARSRSRLAAISGALLSASDPRRVVGCLIAGERSQSLVFKPA